MANYIASYDLNGPGPSHQEMDDHIRQLPCQWARVLETVWYIGTSIPMQDLKSHLASILGPEDLLLVVQCSEATWTKLLVANDPLLAAWNSNR